MRQILIVLGTLFIVLLANAAAIRDEQSQTVLVSNEGFVSHGRGSGILLDETHVLTCAHMLKSPKDELFVYTFPLGSVIIARPEFVDRGADLAVLKLVQPVVVSRYPTFEHHFALGDPLTIVGNALGSMKWAITSGIISSVDPTYLYSDARINHGDSGGPWFDKDGNIVALTDFMILPDEGPGIAGGISAAVIEDFLEERQAMITKLDKPLGV